MKRNEKKISEGSAVVDLILLAVFVGIMGALLFFVLQPS